MMIMATDEVTVMTMTGTRGGMMIMTGMSAIIMGEEVDIITMIDGINSVEMITFDMYVDRKQKL